MPTEIIHTVVGLIARITLDFAIWARDEHLQPILLICEEAQRYLSSHPSANNAPVRDALERIAKEGRKYGVSLGLVTQRPSELSETALSQCGTYITLRLNNENDQERIRLTLPDTARGFVDTISALKNRECIISGEGVVVPLRVTLDFLAETLRPRSEDPSYTAAWHPDEDSVASIERTVRRWRRQGQNRP
jgi:DNA helicase HerA-like ATPase